MQIVIEGEAAAVVDRLVQSGRFASPQQAVLELAADDERHTAWLRAKVQEALDEGGDGTMEDLDRELAESRARLLAEHPEWNDDR